MYREGNMRRRMVKVVERKTARVRSISTLNMMLMIMMMWHFLVSILCVVG